MTQLRMWEAKSSRSNPLKNFESNLDLLAPVVEELKEKLDCPEQETRSLIKKMKDVKQLIDVLRYRRYEQILPHLHQQTNEFG